MPTAVHALDFLAAPAEHKAAAVCVVFGDDPFLKRLVLKAIRRQVVGEDADVPVASYDCQERRTEWRDVAEELATVSLFGGGIKRLVILEGADDFVSAERPKLEDYVARPKSSGVLVLEVEDWPATTRLYKAVDQSGLALD